MVDSTFQMKTLQDYEVESVIGSGAFGTCYKVRDKSTGAIYAWKGMDYDELSETKKESLISEINVLRQLQHPNIVQYYHHLINNETKSIFLVMEYCEGGDLSQLIEKCRMEKKRFEEKYIWRVLFQICKALQVCHNKIKEGTILHRDIKPANIFLDSTGNAKLGDFGLARVLRKNEDFAQTFVGTPYYMSPEIVKGSKYDPKSDVWALGCLTYEMCSLKPPFRGRRFDQLSKNISDGKFHHIPNCYSADLQDIITFMLKVDNDHRPTVDIITRHPILVRNIVEIPYEFPKLLPSTAVESNDHNLKLTFTPRADLSSTALTHFTVTDDESKHITGVSTPDLRYEIFDSVKRRIRCSDPELYESILKEDKETTIKPTSTGFSPTTVTQNIFEKTLQDRLHAIRAYESLLKQREANLLLREQALNDREKRILEMERTLEAKQAAANFITKRTEFKPKPLPRRILSTLNLPTSNCDDTYCSIESNDTLQAPTVAKLNLGTIAPPKPLVKRVTFKSPRKFVKYNIENAPPKTNTLRSSTSSKASDESDNNQSQKRRSIFSIFSLGKSSKDTKSNATPSAPQNSASSQEIVDKCQPEELATRWTTENKRAAFEMLAAMNAAAGSIGGSQSGLIGLRQCRQSVRERGASTQSMRRSQRVRRSVVGLSVPTKEVHGSRMIL